MECVYAFYKLHRGVCLRAFFSFWAQVSANTLERLCCIWKGSDTDKGKALCVCVALCVFTCAGGLTAFPPSLCVSWSFLTRKEKSQVKLRQLSLLFRCFHLRKTDKFVQITHEMSSDPSMFLYMLSYSGNVLYAFIFVPVLRSLFFFCMCVRVFCFLAHDPNLIVTRRHPCHPPFPGTLTVHWLCRAAENKQCAIPVTLRCGRH